MSISNLMIFSRNKLKQLIDLSHVGVNVNSMSVFNYLGCENTFWSWAWINIVGVAPVSLILLQPVLLRRWLPVGELVGIGVEQGMVCKLMLFHLCTGQIAVPAWSEWTTRVTARATTTAAPRATLKERKHCSRPERTHHRGRTTSYVPSGTRWPLVEPELTTFFQMYITCLFNWSYYDQLRL